MLWAATLSGFAVALVAPALFKRAAGLARWMLPLFPTALFTWFLLQIPLVSEGGQRLESFDWLAELGISLALRLDGLSLLFCLLVTGVGAPVMFYANDYLRSGIGLGRFQALTSAFMASMLGLLLADDFAALYVFWELTTLFSFFLIGFRRERAEARAAALQSLLVTAGGGVALLAGGILLELATGTFRLSELLARRGQIGSSKLEPAIMALLLLAAFTKSAQLPFSWWLPRAMEAPTPASAYLHAAAMVKAGVYLMARLSPLWTAGEWWGRALLGIGGATFVVGALRSFSETHFKRVLAQSTVSALGLMMFLLGLGTPEAFGAALAYVVAHGAYKGGLFLVAGAVEHQTETSDLGKLAGLSRIMPFTFAAALAAALSMAGLPPTLGFVSKELAFEAALDMGAPALAVLVIGSALTWAIAVRVGLAPFLGPRDSAHRPHQSRVGSWAPPLLLGLLGFLFGIWPSALSGVVLRAASDVASSPIELHRSMAVRLGLPLALSGLAIGIGVLAYLARTRLARIPTGLGPSKGYAWALRALDRVAMRQTQILQSGYLRHYVLIVLATLMALGGYVLLPRGRPVEVPSFGEMHLYEIALAGIVVASAVNAVRSSTRLSAIVSMGAVGYGVGLLFLLFGAPDLAMTQFVVETLTVILFVFAFYGLPRYNLMSSRATRWRDGAVAITAGSFIAALVLAANALLFGAKISDYFLRESAPAGHGRNVVNVILTDFRALDTLGEVTVLAVAGTGVYALLKLRPTSEGRM